MLTCRQVTERASTYLDSDLGFWEAAQVRMHLIACRYCRAFMRQMRSVVVLVDRLGVQQQAELDPILAKAYRRRYGSASKGVERDNGGQVDVNEQ